MNVQTKKISELFTDIKIGGTPSRGNPAYFGGENLWVSIRDMEGQSLITKTAETISDDGVRNSNCKLIKKGSLLFSFKLTVGRIAFAGADLYTNEAIAAFDPDDAEFAGIDLEYLSLVLPLAAKGDATKNSMGAALLNKEKILNLEIPFRGISEQRCIAARLKAQLAEVHTAQQAVQAQLHDAALLRQRLLQHAFDALADAPRKALGECCTFYSGGTPAKSKEDYWSGEIPWFSPKDIKSFELVSSQDRISDIAVQESATRLVPPGTILVVARSGVLAHTLPVGIVRQPSTFNQDIKAIIPNEDFSSDYITFYLAAKQDFVIKEGVKRGATVHSLISNFIEQLDIPYISIAEQRRIVARLKTQLAEADALRAALEQQLRDVQALPQRILAAAFAH